MTTDQSLIPADLIRCYDGMRDGDLYATFRFDDCLHDLSMDDAALAEKACQNFGIPDLKALDLIVTAAVADAVMHLRDGAFSVLSQLLEGLAFSSYHFLNDYAEMFGLTQVLLESWSGTRLPSLMITYCGSFLGLDTNGIEGLTLGQVPLYAIPQDQFYAAACEANIRLRFREISESPGRADSRNLLREFESGEWKQAFRRAGLNRRLVAAFTHRAPADGLLAPFTT